MTIGKEIKALRAALDEDTATFGQRWHKSGRTIENWEQDRGAPDAFVLTAIRALAAKKQKAQAKRTPGTVTPR